MGLRGEDGDRPTVYRAGFRKLAEDDVGTEYFVLPETWRVEVCAGFDAVAVARVLAERGQLKRDTADDKLQSRHRLPGAGKPVRCYHLLAAILGGDDA